MKRLYIQLTITAIAIGAAVARTFFPDLKIDAITLGFLAVAILPWLQPLFKTLELPGGIKIEFQALKEAEEKIKSSGLLNNAPSPVTTLKPMQKHVYSFQSVSGNDANLALAGLRIEIESRLRDIANQNAISVERSSIQQLLGQLEASGVLLESEVSAIRDLLTCPLVAVPV
jgi:hypothetical protein